MWLYRLYFHFLLSCIGEGNGNPLQCSCLENPRDGGAWWAAIYGVAQSRARLKRLSSSSSMDYNSPGSSVHGISQARILEWIAIYFLLHGIFHIQGSNPHLLNWQADSLLLSHHGSPDKVVVVVVQLLSCV